MDGPAAAGPAGGNNHLLQHEARPLKPQTSGRRIDRFQAQKDRTKSELVDYNLINVDEFDAILIELRVQQSEALTAPPIEFKQPKQPEKYPAKTHARKVKDELKVTSGLVYLIGQNEQTWEDTDGDMPFRQRRFFFYLSGVNFPGRTAITYDIAKDYLTLWVPVRAPAKELWNGTVPSIEECAQNSDVDCVRNIEDINAYLKGLLDPQNHPPTVYVLHESERPPPLDWECPHDGLSLEPDTELLVPAMSRARAVKTAYEISQIQKAVDISSEAHCEVLKHIKNLKNEAQVESIFLSKCRELGAKQQAYAPIAGSGPNAGVLHYNANDQDFGDRQLMVLDAGAEFDCYASDVTRTFPLSGDFTKEAKEIYRIVLRMQDECIAMIRPGQSWVGVMLKAMEVAKQGLLNIGILHAGPSGQMPDVDAVRLFFPHGLGHLVGLDTHDVIANVSVRGLAKSTVGAVFGGKRQSSEFLIVDGDEKHSDASNLKEGMVITCEPGIYFNRAFIEDKLQKMPDLDQYVNRELLEEYYPVGGCRLEDCILVTKDGYENMTTAPKSHEMMKVINDKA
ncbi:unnamed protein product [Discula destructiva]